MSAMVLRSRRGSSEAAHNYARQPVSAGRGLGRAERKRPREVHGASPAPKACRRETEREVLVQRGYLLDGALGSGHYSRVFRARLLDDPAKRVAVKVVELASLEPSYYQEFLSREMGILQSLRHPHVVSLVETFREDTRWFLVTELGEGGDLLSFVQRHGAAGLGLGQRWVRELLLALAFLHGRRIAHRDLKLENVLLSRDRRLIVADFGFSTRLGRGLSEAHCGSRAYMAQEVLRGVPYDPLLSDVWAAGMVALVLLTAEMPFDDHMPTDDILREQRAMRYAFPDDLPREGRYLLRHMLAYRPSLRPSASQLLRHPFFHTTYLE